MTAPQHTLSFSPRDVADAQVGEGKQDRKLEELWTHHLCKGVMPEGKACAEAERLEETCNTKAEDGKGKHPPGSITFDAMNQSECCRWDNVQNHNKE